MNVRNRPDYVAIARIEREVWGQSFEHAGAPEVLRSSPRLIHKQPQLAARLDALADANRIASAVAAAMTGTPVVSVPGAEHINQDTVIRVPGSDEED